MQERAGLLNKARGFKREDLSMQVQREAVKMRSLLAQHEAQRLCIIEALQGARQACLRVTTTCAANEEFESNSHMAKYVDCAYVIETYTQSTPHSARVATLETNVREAKY